MFILLVFNVYTTMPLLWKNTIDLPRAGFGSRKRLLAVEVSSITSIDVG